MRLSEKEYKDIHHAIARGNVSLVEKYIYRGDFSLAMKLQAIQRAAEYKYWELVEAIFESGVDLSKKCYAHYKYSAPKEAMNQGRIDILEKLIQFYPNKKSLIKWCIRNAPAHIKPVLCAWEEILK